MFNFLINLLTFPGVMLHEWSHQFYCKLFRVPVLKVVYFRLGNPMGYVVHAEPRSLSAAFWISIGPLTINSLFALAISYSTRYTELFNLKIFALWPAFAFAFHALPSKQDATNILDKNNSLLRQGKFYYIIFWPFIALAYLILVIANKLKFLSLDFIYAIALMYLAGGLKF